MPSAMKRLSVFMLLKCASICLVAIVLLQMLETEPTDGNCKQS